MKTEKEMGNRKFHVRSLVLAVGDLQVFLYRPMRVLVASEAFSYHRLDNPFIHITNKSLNETLASYDDKTQNMDLKAFCADQRRALTRTSDDKALLEETILVEQMKTICVHVFQALVTNRKHFFTLPNCYELFGFDWMVRASL